MINTVDVIIPVFRPKKKELNRLIFLLKSQTRKPGRIILLHTKSADVSLESYQNKDGIRVIEIEKKDFNHGGTRMLGAEASEAPYLVYMTQDALPEGDDLLEELLRPLEEDEKVAVSYARQLAASGCRESERIGRCFNYPASPKRKTIEDLPKLGIKTYFCSNVCAAYRRSTFDELGGFESPVLFNEDMLYAAKAVKSGYAVYYAADARVYHSHNFTNEQFFRRNFDLGVTQADHPEVFAGIPSEGEGMRLVKATVSYLKEIGRAYEIPFFFLNCASRYAGYFLGKHYRSFPKSWPAALSSNRDYWEKQ